jgi:hypothetical protein
MRLLGPRLSLRGSTEQRLTEINEIYRIASQQPTTHSGHLPSATAGIEEAKARLLEAVRDTNRGSRAGLFQRGIIEELQVAVETSQALQELDWAKLGGLWRLEYTTATDVVCGA